MEFALGKRKIADRAVPLIAQQGFEETDLERLADVEDAKAIARDAPARIAETAWCLAEPKRIGVAIEKKSSEAPARCDVAVSSFTLANAGVGLGPTI
jgi:hypothetical protein